MQRSDVYKVIDTEREYQDSETENTERGDIVDEFDMAHTLLCIDKFLESAKQKWYKDNPKNNYNDVTPYLRMISAVCVKMGEKYGMPTRRYYKY